MSIDEENCLCGLRAIDGAVQNAVVVLKLRVLIVLDCGVCSIVTQSQTPYRNATHVCSSDAVA